jgi:hypothetical protein
MLPIPLRRIQCLFRGHQWVNNSSLQKECWHCDKIAWRH